MPRWLLHAFLAASASLFIVQWIAIAVQNAEIHGLERDVMRLDERVTRTHFLLYP